MPSWKEPVVPHSDSFHIISNYVWGRLKVDSPMTGLLQPPGRHSRSASGKSPRPLRMSYTLTFLLPPRKRGGIGSLATHTWERERRVIPVRAQGWGAPSRVRSLCRCLAKSEGSSGPGGRCALALGPAFWALPRGST